MHYYENPAPRRKRRVLAIALTCAILLLLGLMIALVLLSGERERQAPAPVPTAAVPDTARYAADLSSNPFVVIARDAGPSVVGVSNRVSVEIDDEGTKRDFEQGAGSGVILSEDGLIITNQHVIEDAESVGVILSDGEECEAEILGSDAASDIAVLKIDKTGLIPAKVGSSKQTQVGEFVIVIGSPLSRELMGSVTFGMISATDRMIDVTDASRIELLQTDAAINPGNSGGGLYNIYGELIGINSIKYITSRSGVTVEGVGFAIPIDNVMPIVSELIAKGKIARPVLGIGLSMIDAYTARNAGVPVGVLIRKVYEGSPAEAVGLEEMDIITHIDARS